MDFIELELRDFKTLVKRSDIRSPTWFAVEHNLLLHPDFFDLTGNEVKAYLWICGVATHLNTPKIRAYVDLCCQQIRLQKKEFISSVRKLNGKRWDVMSPFESVRVLPCNIDNACPTGQDTTLQDSTEHDTTGQGIASATSLPALANLWNLHSGKLPKVLASNAKRKKSADLRLREHGAEKWTEAINRIANSDFCNGLNDKSWIATFDWILQPDVYLKITEGKYDNRKSLSQKDIHNIKKTQELVDWANSETEGGLLEFK